MRLIVLDTETTGLEPAQGHRIVEIGAVEVDNRMVTDNYYHQYLNPDRDSDPEALAVHGLTTEFLSGHPRFEEVARDFVEFIRDGELLIHNAAFDIKFLDAELQRVGLGKVRDYCAKVTDSLMVAREMHPGKRNSLDALCDRYGISNAHRTLHGALLDTRLLAEVWLAMTRGQESLLGDVDAADNQASGNAIQFRSGSDDFDPSRLAVLPAGADEIQAHADYLAALDKAVKGECVWRRYEPQSEAAQP
ncbi:DNA polymerase-3 subunit epsilon [Kerstersia gyiorum]|uniref:DNA polymerase III subunit epsilon n=1 Tax=Kerstersia gyiorum TaxID=206506 RepID=UPI0020A03CB0|nr:DNA polymerase III subunit epsilon [Kerstersia gyiorum]MCP1710971.1 DNA polymerase-3 subunit epsilon [Kerstersia gyiorum]